MRIVDLSARTTTSPDGVPELLRTGIEYSDQAEAVATRRPGVFWAAHQAELACCQIERLGASTSSANGLHGCLVPLRLVGGSAAPARVVAIVE